MKFTTLPLWLMANMPSNSRTVSIGPPRRVRARSTTAPRLVSIVAPNGTSSSAVSATKRELPFSRTRTVPDGVTTTVFANSGTGSAGGGGGGGGCVTTGAPGPIAATRISGPAGLGCHTATPT